MRYLVKQTVGFSAWHIGLRDLRAKVAIARRIEQAENGNVGKTRSVGSGVSEMKIDLGPGYRVYFTVRGREVIILLAGVDKSSQSADIRRAHALAKEV
ncbi:MAG: type II toxin-antitoxin system RelE/ParE family toxin [Pseudomonadota bacterium]|jgi:putative addiction module killer protein|nr:type II toxin-antitoxin system RelE/ParE family toxin [Pseudomonadota bacterium]